MFMSITFKRGLFSQSAKSITLLAEWQWMDLLMGFEAREGKRTRCKCGDGRGEKWRQLWVKRGALKHG